ncbi:DNA polymerase III subunit chi [Perlucidibaca piscinae]|uniref:DNA polymerase III subunit chi n=1 Tax=Perlucidibaca piscinae TaxID=392589 RepID=UPI0003B2F00D|nr:DNA polymerase III subunit chi [Perlucidibaca piscinae]
MPPTDPAVEITFYVLPPDAPLTARLGTACRLVDKAWQQNRQVLIQTASRAEAETLDEQLWSFRPESFVPHHLVGEGPTPPPPVRIGWEALPAESRDILINLGADIPDGFQRFQRVIEIVAGSDAEREAARTHWKAYRKLGYQVQAHELKA